jgi:hypothetical protein
MGFFKSPKDIIGKANTFSRYGKMGMYKWYQDQNVRKHCETCP